jgi:glycosyltransferase involved in cell wall biosynthesis
MNRISVCLITLNEEANLRRVLRSVQDFADEIVIVDCGSKDQTAQVAKEFGAVFLFREWTNFAEQKNFAADAACCEWILSLDADEELGEELRRSLLEWKEKEPEFLVYEFARRTWYLGGWVKHTTWYPDLQRRLFKKRKARFFGTVHEALRFEGQAGRLRGDLLHYTVQSFAEHEQKVERYTTLAAEQMYAAGRRSWRGAMWLATPWSWFQNYFLCKGFLDGYRGALIAQMAARAVRLKFAKLGKMIAKEKLDR